MQRFQPHLERAQGNARPALLVQADQLVDDREDVLDAIGRGGVGRPGLLRLGGLARDAEVERTLQQARAEIARQILPVGHAIAGARGRDDLAQDVRLVVEGGTPPEHDIGQLVLLEHPERQIEAFAVDSQSEVREGAGILVMRIEDEHAQTRPDGDGAAQQQRDRARLADAGRPDQREMTRKHVLDADRRGDARILRDMADLDAGPIAEIVDEREIPGADAVGDRADRRKIADAALKAELALGAFQHLAEELDLDPDRVLFRSAPGGVHGMQLVDQRDDAARAQVDRDHAADGPGIARQPVPGRDHAENRGARAVAGDDAPQRPLGRLMGIAPVRLNIGVESRVLQWELHRPARILLCRRSTLRRFGYDYLHAERLFRFIES